MNKLTILLTLWDREEYTQTWFLNNYFHDVDYLIADGSFGDANELFFNPQSDFDHLADGESRDITITYTIDDDNGEICINDCLEFSYDNTLGGIPDSLIKSVFIQIDFQLNAQQPAQ